MCIYICVCVYIHNNIYVYVCNDRFGFKKVIVVITRPGVVAGIHSETGAVVWQV
jgi:hypothetical protein